MRNEKRIDAILQKIAEIWRKFSHLIFGQTVINLLFDPTLYYVEDEA